MPIMFDDKNNHNSVKKHADLFISLVVFLFELVFKPDYSKEHYCLDKKRLLNRLNITYTRTFLVFLQQRSTIFDFTIAAVKKKKKTITNSTVFLLFFFFFYITTPRLTRKPFKFIVLNCIYFYFFYLSMKHYG